MFPPSAVYAKGGHRITLLFDYSDEKQCELLHAFRDAFGECHSDTEALYSPHHLCLHLYPGAALRLAA